MRFVGRYTHHARLCPTSSAPTPIIPDSSAKLMRRAPGKVRCNSCVCTHVISEGSDGTHPAGPDKPCSPMGQPPTQKETMALTPKQEAFALAYVETGNASEAYRRAYNAGNMKPEVIANKASALLKRGDVRVRVEMAQAKAVERHETTVDDILRELEEARALAAGGEKPQPAAMVAASMGKAKLLGMLTDKTELTGKDGGPVENITRIELVPLRK